MPSSASLAVIFCVRLTYVSGFIRSLWYPADRQPANTNMKEFRLPRKLSLKPSPLQCYLSGTKSPFLFYSTHTRNEENPTSSVQPGFLSSILIDAQLENGKNSTGFSSSDMKSNERDGRKFNRLPVPHRSFQEPQGQDLDFVNVAYSHLVHKDWPKLNEMVPGLNAFRVNHVLLKTRKDHLLSYEFFDWVTHQKPNLQVLDTFGIIIHILTRAKKFRLAETVFKKTIIPRMLDFSSEFFDALMYTYRMCDSSQNCFDFLFKSYANLNKFRIATETFCRMKEYGFLPCIKSCNAYMSALLKFSRWDILLSFYGELIRCRISPNVYTLNMVMCALSKSGRIEKALEVFKDMENLGCRPNTASFNTLIDGYCRKRLLVAATKLKNTMQNKGVDPNIVTYNTLINGFCKIGMIHDANKLFTEMKAVNVAPNTVTYNTLITGYSDSGNREMGVQLHEEMVRNGVAVDILTYNALLTGLCRKGKTKEASHLFKRLQEENLVPNASTFSVMIHGHCKKGNTERAYQVYKTMLRSGSIPNLDTFKVLISAFCEEEDFGSAAKMLMEISEKVLCPDAAMMSELVEVLCRCGKNEAAVKTFNELEGRCLIPQVKGK